MEERIAGLWFKPGMRYQRRNVVWTDPGEGTAVLSARALPSRPIERPDANLRRDNELCSMILMPTSSDHSHATGPRCRREPRMHHYVDAICRTHRVDRSSIGDVALDQLSPANELATAE
jgi:hypothetical protein